MSSDHCVGDIIKVNDLVQHVYNDLVALSTRYDLQRAKTALESGKQKVDLFIDTWIKDAPDVHGRSEVLWGTSGNGFFKKTLIDLNETLQKMRTCLGELGSVEPNRVNVTLKWIGWKREPSKKPGEMHSKIRDIRLLALKVDESADAPWTYSEVLFISLHGRVAKPSGSSSEKHQCAQPVSSRQGALALYEACRRLKTRFELDIDVFGQHRVHSGALGRNLLDLSTGSTAVSYHVLWNDSLLQSLSLT